MNKKAILFLCLFVACVQGAWAQIPYVVPVWNGTEVVEEERMLTAADRFGSFYSWDYLDEMTMQGFWFYVAEDNHTKQKITVMGERNILLKDGSKLTVGHIEFSQYGGSLNIYGQKEGTGELIIDATGSGHAGIDTYLGKITIYGGTVIVKGDKDCAAIGGSDGDDGGEVAIYGGTVKAYGGDYAAGIGGGQNGDGGTVVVYGGDVFADGGMDAAGIGSGEQQVGNRHGGSLTVYGGHVFADGTGWGAGIGGGEDSSGATVDIRGGIVEACAGSDAGEKNGCAIGSEDGDYSRGSLSIADHMMVHAGQNPADAKNNIFPSGTRVPACFFRPYARIEPCDHAAAAYTFDDDETHTVRCPNCLYREQEQHVTTGPDHVCTKCGGASNSRLVTFYLPDASGNNQYTALNSFKVAVNSEITLPNPPEGTDPDGMQFYVWFEDQQARSPEEIDISTYLVQSSEISDSWLPLYKYTVKDDVSFTARYKGINITLADDADNGETLYMNNQKTAQTVTLSGRTLHKGDVWNTLCLPFDVTAEQIAANEDLADAQLMTLGGSSFDEQTGLLTLNFNPVSSISAGVPYLVKWASGANVIAPVFQNVVISSTPVAATSDYIDFIGVFSPEIIYEEGNKTNLYLGAGNKLYYPETEGFAVNACRAYFQLKQGLKAGRQIDSGLGISAFNLNFGGEATGISEHRSSGLNGQADAWYTLDGRRLSTKPATRGIYVKNGKKMVVR